MANIFLDELDEEAPKRVFYNLAMAHAVRNVRVPVKGLKMDIRGRPNYIAITVYENNIMQYSDQERQDIMEYLLMVRNVIKSFGTPCELEGVKERERR